MEALARVCLELDVVGGGEADEVAEGGNNSGGWEQHCGESAGVRSRKKRCSGLLLELRSGCLGSVDRELPGCLGVNVGPSPDPGRRSHASGEHNSIHLHWHVVTTYQLRTCSFRAQDCSYFLTLHWSGSPAT